MKGIPILNTTQSVLIIGATGRTGVQCIRHFSTQKSCHAIHAFSEDVSKLESDVWDLCTTVIDGSARHAVDIDEALRETNVDWIILCVGSDDDSSPTNVRTFTAENVVRVLQKPTHLHVQLLAVSIASHSISRIAKCRLRHLVADHRGQEAAIRSIGQRATIVRSTLFQNASSEIAVTMSVENTRQARCKQLSSTDLESESVVSSSSSSSSSLSSCKISSYIMSSVTKSPFRKSRKLDSSIFASSSMSANSLTSIVVFDESKPAPSSQTSRSDLAYFIAEHVCQPRSRSETFDRLYVGDRDLPFVFNVTSVPV